MDRFKGTPGKWHHDTNSESRAIFHPTEIGVRLALVDDTFTGTGWSVKANDEWKANAQLIASAPDLLEALIETTEHLNRIKQYPNDAYFIKNAEVAINKALGIC